MRSLTVAVLLCVSAAATAQAGAVSSTAAVLKLGPAPEIGSGIPVAMAIGGVLLAASLFTRWRRS